MKRRTFLQSVAGGLILWCRHPVPAPNPIITDLEGDVAVEVGPLRCIIYRKSSGTVLDFNVWLIDHPVPGMVRSRLMLCSDTLKKKLEEAFGCPCVLEGHPEYPSLVARMPRPFTPKEVATLLQKLLLCCPDWSDLCFDPDPEGAQRLLQKILANSSI